MHATAQLPSPRSRRGPALLVAIAVAAAACSDSTVNDEGAADAIGAPAVERLYVSEETGGYIVAVDPTTGEVLQRIPVGKRPRGLRVSPDGAHLLVALSGSPIAPPGVDESTLPPADRSADGIGVLSLPDLTLLRTLESGPDPETFDLSPDGATIFVSNEEDAMMSAVDFVTATVVAQVDICGEPEGVGVRPGGAVVYVTCEETHEVAAIDTGTREVLALIPVGGRPRDIVFTPDGALGFVTNETDGSVSVLDTNTHEVIETVEFPRPSEAEAVPPRPMSAVLSPDARYLYVSLGRARSIGVIDVEALSFTRTIDDVGERVWGIAISQDGRTLYTANGPGGDVSVVDIESGSVTTRIATGGSPWGVRLEVR